VICNLAAFVGVIRGIRDVDKDPFVNVPATLRREKRKNARPKRKCSKWAANVASLRVIVRIENNLMTKATANAGLNTKIERWIWNLCNEWVNAIATLVFEAHVSDEMWKSEPSEINDMRRKYPVGSKQVVQYIRIEVVDMKLFNWRSFEFEKIRDDKQFLSRIVDVVLKCDCEAWNAIRWI
jgi:hypothetical protein